MSDMKPTLLEFLTDDPLPPLKVQSQAEGKENTQNHDYVKIKIHNVFVWQDFNYSAVLEMFEDHLTSALQVEYLR